MSELEQLRKIAKELLGNVEVGANEERALALEKAAQALKVLSDAEKSDAEIKKIRTDEKKAQYDLARAPARERLEARQKYMSILAPALTTVVLGLTLVSQTYQFVRSEIDKQQSAEDAQWSDVVKTISQSAMLSPVAVALNPFLKSQRYAGQARTMALQVLLNTNNSDLFSDLFRETFIPVSWSNLNEVLQVNRTLGPKIGELYSKTFNANTKANDLSLLSPPERQQYDYIKHAITEISVSVGPLLKEARPKGQNVDLKGAWFELCDWRGTDLSGADIANARLDYVDLTGADLSNVTSFEGLYLNGTAWWAAKRMNLALREYLTRTSPYDSSVTYGPNFMFVSGAEYMASIARLTSSK